MNHAYRLVWSHLSNSWVAVAETARGRSKKAGGVVVAGTLLLSAMAVQAAPQGGQVVSGSGAINSAGNTTTVTQSSQNLSINWRGFDVAPNETVNFVQPSASAIAVNRVFSTTGSTILGHLNANGQVYLINPHGILFGKGAQVNVGSLVASTLDVNDASLTASSRTFSGNGTGSVVNEGTIHVANGGYVALIGNTVVNNGTIAAQGGSVGLAAGSAVTLNFGGDSLVSVQVDQSTLNNLAANGGLIQADGGTVVMTAGAKDAVLASVVNNTGVVEARTVDNRDGKITLLGGMTAGQANVGGTLDASAPNGGNGGAIETSAAQVNVADGARITTAALTGLTGTWLIDPHDYTVAASGGNMTGAALGSQLANNNVTLMSSTSSTNGAGNVNVNDAVSWSANTTLTLTASNNVNVNANIAATGNSAGLVVNPNTANGADAASGSGTFNLGSGASVTLSGANPSLAIAGHAYKVINSLGSASDASQTSVTSLQGIAGSPTGYYALGSNIDASATSGWNNGAGFTPIGSGNTGFSGTFEGLGHTINNLTVNQPSGINVGLFGVNSGAIRDVGVVGGSVTGASYVGALVGWNKAQVANSFASSSVVGGINVGGLVGGDKGSGSTIVNSYSAGTVSTGGDPGNTGGLGQVGGLVGYNEGAVTNSYSTATVNTSNGINIGGLVGWNYGTGSITGSYALGNVTGNFSATSEADSAGSIGGLVGDNGGTVRNSYAVGKVTGGYYAGGLAGYNYGSIDNTFAIGKVSQGTYVGGLVGENSGGSISNSYSSGAVSGTRNLGGLVGVDTGSTLNSYWNTTTSGQTISGGGVGLSSTDMTNQSKFTGWDFTNTWVMPSSTASYTSPLLKSLLTTVTVTANNVTTTYNKQSYSGNGGYTASVSTGALQGTLTYGGTSQGAVNAGSYTITLSGLSSLNPEYVISYGTGTLTINPITLTLGGTTTVANKVYDGTTTATLSGGTLSGVLNGDTVTLSQSGAFASKNVGNGIAVTASDSLGGASAGNYVIAQQPSGLIGNITPATLTIGGTTSVANKVYDGTTAATLSGGTLSGVISGDTVTLSQSGTFASKNVGNGIAVTASDSLSGASAGNYVIAQQPGNLSGNITPATLTIGGTTTVANKVYDGATTATLTGGTLTGVISGDTVTLTQSGAFASKNVGNGIAVSATDSLGGASAGNYVIAQQPGNLSGNITPATLTVTGTSVADKVYDGTTSATLSGGLLSGVLNGDTVTLSQSGTFASKNVGNGVAVTASDSLGGASAGNYVIAQQPSGLIGNITPATLTIGGTTSVADKVYNGTNAATLSGGTLSGVISGDTVTLSQSGTFASKNVGNGVVVTASDSLSGSSAGNYVIAQQPGNLSGNITPATLTIGGTTSVADKVYDGATTATLTGGTLSGLVSGDHVSLAQSGVFASKNVGNGIAVTASDSLSGADASNYVIAQQPGNLSGNITPATLTVGGTSVATKTYDGTTSATLSGGSLSGVISGDTVTLSQSGTFASKNVGNGIAVTASDSLGGASAGNYVIAQPSQLNGNITPATLTVGGTSVADKVYDGTNAATLTGGMLSGVIGGDTVTLSQSGTFASKNVGNGVVVTASDSLGGADAGNYAIAQPSALSASITPATVTVANTGVAGKVYDGTTAATLTGGTLSGVIGSDQVTLTQAGQFATKNAGSNIAVSANDTLAGTDAGNYVIAQQPAGLTGNITPATLTIGGTTVADKVYDGTTSATLSGGALAGLVSGDNVTLTQSGAFATKNAGSGIAVAAQDSLSGTDAGNYVIAQQPAGLTGNITPATLTIGGTSVATKTYDGTTAATLTGGTLSGLIGADQVSLTQSGQFTTKNAGSNIAVSANDVLAGADAGNYVVSQPTGLVGSITPATVSIAGTSVASKVYDGTTAATLTGGVLSGLIGSDDVSLAQTGQFATKNAGSGIAVTAQDSLSGADAGNYVIAQQPAGLTASIAQATLSVGGTSVAGKVYDGTTAATLTGGTLAGVISGDQVTLTQSGAFASKDVGNGIAVTAQNSLSGADAGNYAIAQSSTSLSGSITPATLTYTANAATLPAGQSLAGLSGTIGGFVTGDTLASATTGSLAWTSDAGSTAAPGQYAIDGSGLAATNYVFVQASGNATALTLTPVTSSGSGGSTPVVAAASTLQTATSATAHLLAQVLPQQPGATASTLDTSSTITAQGADSQDAGAPQSTQMWDIGGKGTLRIENQGVRLPGMQISKNP